MLIYYMSYILLSSLVGLILMELGQFGPDISMVGHPNGASLQYVLHVSLFFLSFFLFKSLIKLPKSFSVQPVQNNEYFSTAGIINALLLAALMYLLFIAGAHKVWSGEVTKGQFRSNLGSLGAITYFLLYFIIPSSIALISIQYASLEKKDFSSKALLISSYCMAFLFGASWGFKSTAIQLLLPGLSFLFWKLRIKQLMFLFFIALFSFVAFAVIFDGNSLLGGIKQVLVRLTIVQGDLQWFIWEQYMNHNIPEFSYSNFLLASLGDTFINNVFNYSIGSDNWTASHYTNFVTQMVGYKDGGIAAGHNVQGGVFSEGVLALGHLFFLLSIFSGALAGYVYGLIRKFYFTRKYISASVLCTYFVFILVGWINCGGAAVLIHVAIVTEFIITIGFFKLISQCKFYIHRTDYA